MNDNLFTVGELSVMTGVSKQAIRYYDNIGLLKPEETGENNYRYYKPIHILYLNTIMRLSQLGCSLNEIKRYLSGDNLNEVKKMLGIRRALTEQKINELERSLHTIENQIGMIDMGIKAKQCSDIAIKHIQKRRYVYIAKYTEPEIKNVIIQVNKLVARLYKHGMLFVGSPVFEITNEEGLLKTGFFINGEVNDSFMSEIVPAGDFAYIYHKGAYENMPQTAGKLNEYIEKNKLQRRSNTYQLFLIDMALTKKDEELLTELQVKIK